VGGIRKTIRFVFGDLLKKHPVVGYGLGHKMAQGIKKKGDTGVLG
jgi:hypothetical protein